MAANEKDLKALPGEEDKEASGKPSKIKKIVILSLILILLGAIAGGAAYWWFFLRGANLEEPADPPAAEAPAAPAAPAEPDSPVVEPSPGLPRNGARVLPLPEIVVNISDTGSRKHLKLGMEVEVNTDISRELKENTARIRDAVIMILAGKNYADIASPEGKVLLKGEVAARLNQILGVQRVVRVYFTDFVVE